MSGTGTLDLGLADLSDSRGDDGDNVTDWALNLFRKQYGPHVSKDDVWEYVYGVMHAPDWRERYQHDLQRNLPRIPLADDFEAFRAAGRELMDLHVGYETCPEHPDVICEVDGHPDEGDQQDPGVYRMGKALHWGHVEGNRREADMSVLVVNDRVRLTGIPVQAHDYVVSGRSPLQWAVSSLAHKVDKRSQIADDPNGWQTWASDPFELVRHLRRLVFVSVRSAEIVESLPRSLPAGESGPGPVSEGCGR